MRAYACTYYVRAYVLVLTRAGVRARTDIHTVQVSEKLNVFRVSYSTAQRKVKRIPREIRVRAADRMLIIRGSMMVNLRVTTASPRQIRSCMYRGSARVSYCIRASQYSTRVYVQYIIVCACGLGNYYCSVVL